MTPDYSHTPTYTLNIRGKLYQLASPKVMGIINVTPDSFFSGSRVSLPEQIAARASQMLEAGADMLDLGAYSTRPGAAEVSAEEEYSRLARGLEAIRRVAPEAIVSIDTFRADVAARCVREWEADIINDVSGGLLDARMPQVAAELSVPVVVMHMRGTPATMQSLTDYGEDSTSAIIAELAERIQVFRSAGVADVIADPGFGFAKTLEQNYALMNSMRLLKALDAPLLVGISRKSMIFKPLGITPAEALPGTIALNMAALERGAMILRVHDVKEAVQTVKIFQMLHD